MSAFNVVRFKVKLGREQEFIDLHRSIRPNFKGHLGADLIRTGEQTFCMIGKWRSMDALAAARPEMIAVLDQLRGLLEDLGGDLGVTDPVAGETVASFTVKKKSKAKGRDGKRGKKKKAAGKAKLKGNAKVKSKEKKSKQKKSKAKKAPSTKKRKSKR